MEVVYEVNIEVDPSIAELFQNWLPGHVQKIQSLDGFLAANIFTRKPSDEGLSTPNKLWTVHYRIRSRKDLESYFQNEAPRLRQDAETRFGPKIWITRRILETN